MKIGSLVPPLMLANCVAPGRSKFDFCQYKDLKPFSKVDPRRVGRIEKVRFLKKTSEAL